MAEEAKKETLDGPLGQAAEGAVKGAREAVEGAVQGVGKAVQGAQELHILGDKLFPVLAWMNIHAGALSVAAVVSHDVREADPCQYHQ